MVDNILLPFKELLAKNFFARRSVERGTSNQVVKMLFSFFI